MFDFKKEQKDLYQPKATPSIIEVPEMLFLAVDGAGNPNTSEEYQSAVDQGRDLRQLVKGSVFRQCISAHTMMNLRL